MKSPIVLTAVVALLPTVALAQDDNKCTPVTDYAWKCPVPLSPPKCMWFGEDLLCTGPVSETTKPTNCAWQAGKYICRHWKR